MCWLVSVLDAARSCGHVEAHLQPSGRYPSPSALSVQDLGLNLVGGQGPARSPPCAPSRSAGVCQSCSEPGPLTLPLSQPHSLPPAVTVTKTQGWAPPSQLCKWALQRARGQSVTPLWGEDSWGTPDPIWAFQELQGHGHGSKMWPSATQVMAEENHKKSSWRFNSFSWINCPEIMSMFSLFAELQHSWFWPFLPELSLLLQTSGFTRSSLYHHFFSFIFINWRLITLQYCSGFCHTLTWISHGFTCFPHPVPPSHLPLHPIPLGLPSAPGPSTCLMHPTWAGDLFHPR